MRWTALSFPAVNRDRVTQDRSNGHWTFGKPGGDRSESSLTIRERGLTPSWKIVAAKISYRQEV